MRKLIFIASFLTVFALSGCSTTSDLKKYVEEINAEQEAKYSPIRTKFTDHGDGKTSMEFPVWAGTVGESAFHDQFKDTIFEAFSSNCGFEKDSLKEFRIVKHDPPVWYEVWVFNDPNSKRLDKTSGISVVVRHNTETNYTKAYFYGNENCFNTIK
ncbi:MAG: hypothetical protein AB7D06_02485 [Pedobacter sp.]